MENGEQTGRSEKRRIFFGKSNFLTLNYCKKRIPEMKKIIALFGIICLCGFHAFAETKEINNNNSFEETENGLPNAWAINQVFKGNNTMGTIQVLSESAQDGKNCLMIKNATGQFFHLWGAFIAASPGDVIRMSAYVKGKGTFRLSVYMYNSKNAWLENIYPKSVKIESSDWEKKDFEMTLPDKEFNDKGQVAKIRPVIVIDADSEIYLDNFSGQIANDAKPAKTSEVNGTATNSTASASRAIKTINFNPSVIQKDISECYSGVQFEEYPFFVDTKWALGDGRKQFSQFARACNLKYIALQMQSYSFRGEKETHAIWKSYHLRNGRTEKVADELIKTQHKSWFSPKSFFSFCKDNEIFVTPTLSDRYNYNSQSGKGYWIADSGDEGIRMAARENAAFVKWIINNGYKKQVIGYIIGDEPWWGVLTPEQYIKFANWTIEEIRTVDPNAQFALPFFLCVDENYVDLKTVLAKLNDTRVFQKKEKLSELEQYQKTLAWCKEMMELIGKDAQKFTWAYIHTYGATPRYNSNYKGLETHDLLVKSNPFTKHLKLINTEWRFTSSGDLTSHRNFKTGALWNAKFLMTMIAYPSMSFNAAHTMLCYTGLGYYSNGEFWERQFPEKGVWSCLPDDSKQKQFATGPYAFVMKIFNDMVSTHPVMLTQGSDIGNNTSADYYLGVYRKDGTGRDLQWMLAVDRLSTSLQAVFINTRNETVTATLNNQDGRIVPEKAQITVFSCVEDKLYQLQYPGKTPPWREQQGIPPPNNRFDIPANSIVNIVVPLIK